MSFLPNQNSKEVIAQTSYWDAKHAERHAKKVAKQAARAGKQAVSSEVSIPVQSYVAQIAERITAHGDSDVDFIANQLRATEDELKIGQVAKGIKALNGDISAASRLGDQLSASLRTVKIWGEQGGLTAEASAFPIIDMVKLYEQTHANAEVSESDKYSMLAKAGGNAILLNPDGVTQEIVQTVPGIPGAFQVNTMAASALGENHVMLPEEIGIVVTE